MSIKAIWIDYCKHGSTHGLRHIIQDERKSWERFMWIFLMIVASITILVLVSSSWEKYSYSSMEIVVDNPRYPLNKIDFPAVTICPINKIMYTKALDLILNKYSNDSDLKTRWSNSLQTFGRMRFPQNTNLYFFLQNKSTVNIPLEDISDIMLKLAPTVEDIFYKCFWRGVMYRCADILRFQRTEEGFCYSFNSKTAERNSSHSNNINPPFSGLDGELIPLRNNAAGKGTGLRIIMHNMSNEFFPDDERRRGYNVMVHTPEMFPDVSTGYKLHAVRDRIARISVSVAQVKADESLNRLSKHNSHCFMYDTNDLSNESKNEDMCYSKCRLRTVYTKCKCTQYFFKPYEGLGTHCGIQHIPCLIVNDVIQRNPSAPKDEPGFPDWSIPVSMNCSCPPPCSFITYTTELQQDIRQLINSKLSSTRYMVNLEVNYRELFATSFQRSMKYSTQDLLVSFGGVASLFLGCSLVSIVELLYVVYKTLFVMVRKHHHDANRRTATLDDEAPPRHPFIN